VRVHLALLLAMVVITASCGYRTSPKGAALPQVQTLAVPAFVNKTQSYRAEQILNTALVRELNTRTKYHVIHQESSDADATLRVVVSNMRSAPVTYDSITGRISSSLVEVKMRVSLVDRQGKVLFENTDYTFREEYQISAQVSSFFDEETPALDRMSRDFARSLVSTILEGF
jgi:outer membrane lipopolysaccharide assembly protein LptE/RlpB